MRHAFGKFGLLLTPKSGHTVYKIPLILAYKKRKKNIFCIHVQCDQIWRNLTTLARCYKTLAILKNVHLLLGKILSLFYMVLGKRSVLQMAKYWTNTLAIWSHRSSRPNLISRSDLFKSFERFRLIFSETFFIRKRADFR